ncbi:ABC transporter substrate-binding protein [Calothrix sp. PCC 6303]|uniref:ABC transporter substrate-binding protein n=1 Tax=Calothrix sp. PCC 6303 TaxID=1170562 RepID=UPI0002A053AD|nr:ABC transporter substrate-binding protein [Calothrix sp. PCC 6303]AFZ02640.1 periplasmic binding protein [Calothrix sp. PCC 6303]
MFKKIIAYTLTIFLSLTIVACAVPNSSKVEKTPDNQSSTINSTNNPIPTKSAERIVALTSLSADIIYQLDKSKLVGITGSSLLNKDTRFKDIPRVSEGQVPPNLEKIVALKPDLVIGAEGFSNQTTDKIKELGIPIFLTKVDRWESLGALTKNIAQTIKADPTPLINRYQSLINSQTNPNISTLVLVSRQPILSPNASSWAGNLLSKFSVKNITDEIQGKSPIKGYITLSAEKILEANPEILIVVNPPQGGSGTSILDEFKKEPFWNQLQAIKNDKVYVFDYYGLINAGSINSIEQACQQLNTIFAKS